jgi:8-oxo-dGTP pyrophosphatase MutT (NUDIX family)
VNPVEDVHASQPVSASKTQYVGHIWSVRTDTVHFGDVEVQRDVIEHPGAVAIAAIDDQDRILLICQYRHPVGAKLWELPAGLLDVAGEDPVDAARRELAEETGLCAAEWHVLLDLFNSPGGSSEGLRVFLARGVNVLPEGRWHTGEAEELDLPQEWVGLAEARELVLSGCIHNGTTVAGILAAHVARDHNWSTLRPANDSWEWRPPSRSSV